MTRIGAVGYCTEQGLGYLLKSFYDAGVVNEVLLVHHSHHANHPDWYPASTPLLPARQFDPKVVNRFLGKVDVVLFFETPFDWSLLSRCKEQGVRTVGVPMYEWWPKNPPFLPDRIVAPSLLDRDIFPGSTFVPIPVEGIKWGLRTSALRFLHNAGHVGHREHKGTRQLLEALKYVKSDLTLTVRAQEAKALESIVNDVNPPHEKLTLVYGELPRSELFKDHDVYIAPEKFNGLSLPLQEARAAGLLVMTSDRYPHNTWLPRQPLIPVSSYQIACVSRNYLEFSEAIITPEDIAATMDYWCGKDITFYSRDGLEWAQEHSWKSLKQRWLDALSF